MATFRYKALRMDGTMAQGDLEAADRNEAMRRLSRQGLQPVSVDTSNGSTVAVAAPGKSVKASAKAKSAKPAKVPSGAKADNGESTALVKGGDSKDKVIRSKATTDPKTGKTTKAGGIKGPVKLKRSQVVMFTEEISDLLEAGLQLEPALRVMENREELSTLKDVTTLIRQQVRDGTNFSAALRNASPSFGSLYCSMAHAGEVSGALPKILRRQAEYLVTIQDLQSKVLFALIYPAFLILAGIGVTVLFVVYLIPRLMGLLTSTGGALPLPATMLMSASEIFKSYWWVAVLGIVAVVVGFKMWVRNDKNRATWDAFTVKAPLFGSILSARFYVQSMETMANLVGNGMPLLRGLELTRDTTMNLYLRGLMTRLAQIVGEGGSLSRGMKRIGFFPPMLIDMIAVGEQTGDIESALRRTAKRYDKELAKTIDKISALIQPMIVFVMAGVVGGMAYLMISIIFDAIGGINT